ncbi:MAG: protein kinase [Candidatus Acidiferrales bacterium]
MTLPAGTKLGPYEILEPIGAGGMGEVYRARDARLGRDVAIKVLPEAFARDAERLSRFQREAKVLASLNHPNIAAIYGFEDSGNVHALVMELVEGPTLADRIARGAVPIDEALPIARQIAEGVEYAHERGIVHRDLKPANIKLADNDAVKILDFGLAKAMDADASHGDISSSPTISRLATQAGIILGTAAYMSPEQAKGKVVDRRTDIWAFGCVLYEMLTGKMAFSGESITETLAAVIREEPDWSLLPADTPPAIRGLLARCLKKDARQRLQSIGDARIAIEEVLSGAPGDSHASAAAGVRASLWRRTVPCIVAAIAVLAAIAFGVRNALRPPAEEQPSVLAFIPPPPDTSFRNFGFSAGPVVVSPDGKQLAFSAIDQKGVTKLWIRPLSSEDAAPVAGTEDASEPFWSPDSRAVGFFAGNKLKTVDLDNGTLQGLTDALCADAGGAWSKDGNILFTPNCLAPLNEVSASGGSPRPITKLEDGELQHRKPACLPDGRHFVYEALYKDGSSSPSIWIASLDSSEQQLVLKDARQPQVASGYLLFIRGVADSRRVFAQRFDPASDTLAGKAIVVAASQDYSVSGNGVLAFQGGSPQGRLEWFDRGGNSLGTVGEAAPYEVAKISPDGARFLADIADVQSHASDLWSFPVSGGVGTRLTFGPGDKVFSVWSPDGKFIAYSCHPNGKPSICRKPADGSGAEETLVTLGAGIPAAAVVDWSPDSRYLSLNEDNFKETRDEIWVLPLFGDRKPFQPVPAATNQFDGEFSPDGHWFAYFSYESGRSEVYVVPFPGPGGKYQISQTGGWDLRWDKKGHLYFLTMGNRLMEADLETDGNSLQMKAVHPLFKVSVPSFTAPFFDVTPDGSRFLVITSADPTATGSITVLSNWQAAMKNQ